MKKTTNIDASLAPLSDLLVLAARRSSGASLEVWRVAHTREEEKRLYHKG